MKRSVFIFIQAFIILSVLCSFAGPIPDTGQTKCYNNTEEIPCPAPGEPFYGQDGNYLINPPSYTKLDAQGNDLPDGATEWVMVRDNVTGLVWEMKTDDGSIHDRNNSYTWCDSNPDTNGGDAGTCGEGTDTEDFIDTLNTESYGGFSDWRVPTREELRSIVDSSQFDPSIDSDYFVFPAGVVTSSTYSGLPSRVWHVEFTTGTSYYYTQKSSPGTVRAVRGGSDTGLQGHLVDNGDGTITDASTGLMWQRDTDPGKMSWEEALSHCDGLSYSGYDDWRMPNIKELASLPMLTKHNPAANTIYFPDTQPHNYWSSTSLSDATVYAEGHVIAWRVGFEHGDDFKDFKNSAYYVRAVRGGQSKVAGNLHILTPEQATSWTIGSEARIVWETKDIAGGLQVLISRNGGKTFDSISDSTENDGDYVWQVAGPSSYNCMLRLEPVDDRSKGTTQGLFTILSPPAAPTGLGASSGDSQVTLTWAANSERDLISYNVYGDTSPNPSTLLTNVSVGTHTYTHTGLDNRTTYYYRISAVGEAGEGDKTGDVYTTPWAPGPNEVSGILGNSQTLAPIGSPFVVTGSIKVDTGVVLGIEAGTQLRFAPGTGIQVDGALVARGTSDNPIQFVSNEALPEPGSWGQILFTDASTDVVLDDNDGYVSGSVLQHCVISDAGKVEASIRSDDAGPLISDCVIRNSASNGLSAYGGSVIVRNSTISDNNRRGILFSIADGSATLIGSTVSGNGREGVCVANNRGNVIVVRSTIVDNGWDGLALGNPSGSAVVTDNEFARNYRGVYVSGCCSSVNTGTISRNVIHDNHAAFEMGQWPNDKGNYSRPVGLGAGMYLLGRDTGYAIEHNVICSNTAYEQGAGIYLQADLGYYSSDSLSLTIQNNVIADNSVSGECGVSCGAGKGGFYLSVKTEKQGQSTISNNAVVRNTAPSYGTGYLWLAANDDTTNQFQHNVVVGNTTTNPTAPNLGIVDNYEYANGGVIENNNIARNVAPYVASYVIASANSSRETIDIEGNWWGTAVDGEIQPFIHDFDDDSSIGVLDYAPFLITPDVAAPISPPDALSILQISPTAVRVQWAGSQETDLAGYRVFWGTKDTFSYDNVADVQENTSHTIDGLALGTVYRVAVTAYDQDFREMKDDPDTAVNEYQTNGHESWFSVKSFTKTSPPDAPSSPQPSHMASYISTDTSLSWECADPDAGDVLEYDIYVATDPALLSVVDSRSAPTYDPGSLDYGRVYYWRVVARDNHGVESESPVWRFNTGYDPAGDTDNDKMMDDWEITHLDDLSHDGSGLSDADTLTDLQEYQNNTDPNDPDTDDDAIPDGWEVDNGLDPKADDAGDDPDGDKFTNGREYQDQTDPQNPGSHLILPQATGRIPDTGQTKCYDNSGEIPCPQRGEPFYGQDGNYTINPPSYIKMDIQGNYLADSAAEWAMVRDNVTGLIWEVKTDDGSIHDKDNVYTWCNSDPATNKGFSGECGQGTSSESFADDLKLSNFGGRTNWRVPAHLELLSIIDYGKSNPTINLWYYPNTYIGNYWTITRGASGFDYVWRVDFSDGQNAQESVTALRRSVRAVSGLELRSTDRFINNGDGTITDTHTGLMWQQPTATGTHSWQQALYYCDALAHAGFTDWRLPTIREALSLLDWDQPSEMIDTTYFPDTGVYSMYWLSTTYADDSSHAWLVESGHAEGYDVKPDSNYVRAVRGGQALTPGCLAISSPLQASRWGSGELMPVSWNTGDVAGNVVISLSRDAGKTYESIADNAENGGEYDWLVTGSVSANCMLRIVPLDDPSKATIQGLFTIASAVPPSATVSGKPSDPANQDTATLNVDGESIISYRYRMDDGEYSSEILVSDPIELINLADGNHTVYALGRDAAGDWQPEDNPTTISWTVDTTKPEMTGLSNDSTPTQSKTWTWDATDASTVTYRYLIDQEETWPSPSGEYADIQTAAKDGVDGTWYLHVQGKDAAGNESNVVTVYAILDNTPSVASVTNPPPALTNQPTVGFSVSGQDVTHYRYKLDAADYSQETPIGSPISLSGLSEGDHTVYIVGRDTASNWQLETSALEISWSVDLTKPKVTGLVDDATPTQSKTWSWEADEAATFRYAIDRDDTWISPSGDFTDIREAIQSDGNGTWYIHVQAKDTAGNESDIITVMAILDNAGPAALISGMPASPTKQTDLSLTVSGDDVTHYRYKLDDNAYAEVTPIDSQIVVTDLSEGTHTIDVLGMDALGNWQENATVANLTVDLTAPSIAGLSDDPNPTRSKTWIWDADDASNVTFRYEIDQNGTWDDPTGVYTDERSATKGNGDGTWYLHVQAIDAALNASDVVTVSAILDNTAPIISASPPAGLYNSNQSVSLSIDEVGEIYYTFGQTPDRLYVLPLTVDTSMLIKAMAIDALGNQSEVCSFLYELDKFPPDAPIINPTDNTTEGNNPLPTFTWGSVADAHHYELEYAPDANFTSPIQVVGLTDTSYSLTDYLSTGGIWYWRVAAVDEAGNPSDWSTYQYNYIDDGSIRKAVIVAGSGGYAGNALWPATVACADKAFDTLFNRGYRTDRIEYLSHQTYSENPDVDGVATGANLEAAITQWAIDADEFVLYLNGHGRTESFSIGASESISASDLDTWLDALQYQRNTKVIVIYEACHAGSFLSILGKTGDQQRIVITSSDADQRAWLVTNGTVSFSWPFWTRTAAGFDVNDAFANAKNAIPRQYSQTPLIDADGDGIGNEKSDKIAAHNLYIGYDMVSAAEFPTIASVSPTQMLSDETTVSIFADGVTGSTAITRVWATVLRPDFEEGPADDPVTYLPEIELTHVGSGRYEGSYDNLDLDGRYILTVYAKDSEELISEPMAIRVLKNVVLGDINGDSFVDLSDLVVALKVASGIGSEGVRTDYAASGVDVNGDDRVGLAEVIYIAGKVVGLQ